MFYLRNSINSSLFWWGSWDPIWKNFFGSSPITTFTRSSHFASSVGLSMDNAGDFNCYKPFSPWVKNLASGLCWMAATIHCLAKFWSPSISLIWPLDGYLTSGAEWKKLLPKCEAKVWQQLLYRESMHPRRWNLPPPSLNQSAQVIWFDLLG